MVRFLIVLLLMVPAAKTYALTWQSAVYHYANLYRINPCVIFAIVNTESSGNPNAITINYRSGYRSYRTRRAALHLIKARYRNIDIGLMQINYFWISKKLKVSKSMLLNPLYNIDIGEWLFKNLLVKYDHNYRKAIAAYHSSDPAKGRHYLNKVLQTYNRNRRLCQTVVADR